MAKTATGAGSAENEETAEPVIEGDPLPDETPEVEDFDKERALSTIRAQRESEKKLKAELASYREAEEAEAEKNKSLEEKLADKNERIKVLENGIASLQIETDFRNEANDLGIADPDLAFIAAEKAGLLGEYDPKTGSVGVHDFDELVKRYPVFAPERVGTGATGDAGRRGGIGNRSPNEVFNATVRSAMSRR